MIYLKMIWYGIYLVWMRAKGIKRDYLEKHKGEKVAWEYAQEVYRKWSIFTINIIGIELQVEGRENIPDETCVFVGNHQSILDIPTLRIATGRSLDFVAKKELANAPLLGYWITHVKSVTLDRENVREGMKAINTAINNIKDGYTFGIFPEGTRSKDGEIHEFKKGSMKLATKSKVPIVPFSIEGTGDCFENKRKFLPGKVVIKFGKPIATDNLSKEEEKELTDKVKKQVCELYFR